MGRVNHLAFELALAEPWQIVEDDLALLLAIANRETERRQPGDPGWEPDSHRPRSLALSGGRAIDDTRDGWMRNGIAIIPIMGPIFRRANLFTELSGATSLEVVAADIATVMKDPAVRGVILEIDSPGGQSAGIAELASHLHEYRSAKPIVAYVGASACSAAYYLASACSEIVLASNAVVGSIGTIWPIPVTDEATKKRRVEFISSQSPNKNPDPTTERGKEQYQSVVDQLTEVFLTDVARYRNTTRDVVASDFGAGGIRLGRDAVDHNMADRLGTLEATIAELASEDSGRPSTPRPQPTAKSARPPARQAMRPVADRSDSMTTGLRLIKAAISQVPDDFDLANPAGAQDLAIATLRQKVDEQSRQIQVLTAQTTAIQRQFRATELEAIEERATAFVEALLRGRTAASAERDDARAAYVQAARDDLASPIVMADGRPGVSRVALLASWQARRPQLTEFGPTVGPSDAQPPSPPLLASRANPPDPSDSNAPVDPARIKALLAMTSLGQAALDLRTK